MIIKGTFLYTPALDSLEIRENQYLHIEGGRVKKFYQTLPEKLSKEPVTDYKNAVIIPAFTDLHIHGPQFINRGIGFDKELLPWLETYTFPAEGRFKDPAFAGKAYRLFLNRLWEAGTMRFSAFATIHRESSWEFMKLCEQSGLCAYIGKVNMDRNAPAYLLEDTEQSLADTEELICRSKEELHHVKFIATPRFVPSTTEKMMEGLGRLCEKYDLPIQSHLSENQREVAWVKELHRNLGSYTEVYDAFGLLRPGKTIMAHAIYLSEKEKESLREKEIYLAHCAMSNANLTSGIMPLRKNLEQGLNCVIASDVAGGHTPAMNRNLAMTVGVSKLQELQRPKERSLSLPEALYLATKKPGEFFGKVGSFEEGYEFDALVIQMDEPEEFLERTPFEKLEVFLYDGDDRNITARYCRGQRLEKPF